MPWRRETVAQHLLFHRRRPVSSRIVKSMDVENSGVSACSTNTGKLRFLL